MFSDNLAVKVLPPARLSFPHQSCKFSYLGELILKHAGNCLKGYCLSVGPPKDKVLGTVLQLSVRVSVYG